VNENHAQVHLITSNLSPGAQLDTVMVGTFPRCLFVRTNAFSNNKNSAINESKFDFSKVSDDHVSITVCCWCFVDGCDYFYTHQQCLQVASGFPGLLWGSLEDLFCAWLKK